MAGGGNDFVIFDNRAGNITNPEALARTMCTRRLSVGADGLILVENSGRATFRMRYFNSDGSAADFCANGTRCAARFAFLNVIAQRKMTIETDAGMIGAEVVEQSITLSLPPPRDFRPELRITTDGATVRGSYILMGVPHYVIFLQGDIWAQDIEALGRVIRFHPILQPDGANVNFVLVRGRRNIDVRTYERGVEAETLSCGSGVLSSVSVSALFGRVDSPVTVRTRSGIEFQVAFRLGGSGSEQTLDELKLTGDARLIYRALMTPETTEGFDPEWVRNPTLATREP